MIEVKAIISSWQEFLKTFNWQEVIKDYTPKQIGCGLVYELPNFLHTPDESFAVADMRELKFAEPHYHPHETEIYFVLAGTGLVVVGGKLHKVKVGDVVVIPPDTAHFTIPNQLVIAAVSIPPFKPENYVPIIQTDPALGFNREQFEQLTSKLI